MPLLKKLRQTRSKPKGNLTVQPINHGAVVFTWDNKTIYVDPYGGPELYQGIADPDLLLITDFHGDHLDGKTLKALNLSKATLVVPQAVADILPERYKERLVVLKNGESASPLDIQIRAIPMYNLPESADAFHTKGRGNGYVITLGGKNIYLSGDTEDIAEMRALKGIDLAFVCMNLPWTMNIEQAASAVLEFKPKIFYPYHYKGEKETSDIEAVKRMVNEGNRKIEVRLRNWYPAQPGA